MIGYLEGTIVYTDSESICLLCGGVGYVVKVSQTLMAKIIKGDELALYIYTNYGKDGEVTLYGFELKEELDLCKILLNASGVGPKSVLSFYDNYSYSEVIDAILTDDIAFLSKPSGISDRIATKIVADCKKKLTKSGISASAGMLKDSGASSETVSNVTEALVSLGYSKANAIKAVKSVEGADSMDESDLLSKALRIIISL